MTKEELLEHNRNCRAISYEYSGDLEGTCQREILIDSYLKRHCPKNENLKWFRFQVQTAKP